MLKTTGQHTTNIMTTILWTLTAAAVGVEVHGAIFDPAATWTESLARHVPAPLVLAGAAFLAGWLPGHFQHAYAQEGGGPHMGPKAKMWVSVIGTTASTGITAAVQALPDGQAKTILTIAGVVVSGALTTLGVYQVKNGPELPPAEPDAPAAPAEPAPVPVPAGK